jgi:nuclear receptor subfamily 5 group A protein 3
VFTGKSVCKYLGGQNGVTVSVVSSRGPSSGADSGSGSADSASASVDDVEGDSDGEVSRIDFRGVNLRTKKKREAGAILVDNSENSCSADAALHQQPERPMSWEGELSDQEMSSNTITNQASRWIVHL